VYLLGGYMTDYTPPIYTRTICNKAPDKHLHAELHENYMQGRRNREQVQTNPPAVVEVVNTEGEVPILERAEFVPAHLFNGS
jgi:hypothetical protein